MGLQADLDMSGNDFSWLATAFFIAYAVAEVPQGMYAISVHVLPCHLREAMLTDYRNPSPALSCHQGAGCECLLLGRHPVLFSSVKYLCKYDSTTDTAGHHGGCYWYVTHLLSWNSATDDGYKLLR